MVKNERNYIPLQNWLLLSMLFFSLLGSRGFSKICSNVTQKNGTAGYALYLLVTGFIACIFFFCNNGFRIYATFHTLLYAFTYALIAISCMIFTLKAYLYAPVALVTVLTNACSLIATAVAGSLLFHESIEPLKVLRILIMLVAIFMVFADIKSRETTKLDITQKKKLRFFLVLLVLIISSTASVIELKYYAVDIRVTDDNSMFFFTNVFIILFVILWLVFQAWRDKATLLKALPQLRLKMLLPICGETICSNIHSLVSLRLIAQMDVLLYTPMVSAMAIIGGVAASILFREKFGFRAIIAMLLAFLAAIL